MKRRSIIFTLVLLLAFSAAMIPQKRIDAKSTAQTKWWYGKYWELKETVKKSVKFKVK